jgi:hypothetical protein
MRRHWETRWGGHEQQEHRLTGRRGCIKAKAAEEGEGEGGERAEGAKGRTLLRARERVLVVQGGSIHAC